MRECFKDATSQSVYVVLRLSTTGLAATGKLYTDITGSYTRSRAARVGITMATLASASAAWSSGGFILVDDTNCPGLYRFDVPDAAFATGADRVIISLKATGVLDEHLEVVLINWNKQVGAVPNAVAGATGGLPTVDSANGVTLTTLESLNLHSGTAQSGSTSTTIKLATGANSTTDDIYKGCIVKVYGGTGAGQSRTITSYIASTRVATVDRAWAVTPDNTSTYAVLALVPDLTRNIR